jgi:hypothetical protein
LGPKLLEFDVEGFAGAFGSSKNNSHNMSYISFIDVVATH